MPDVVRRSGVRVAVPDGLTIVPDEPRPSAGGGGATRGAGRRGSAATPAAADPESDALVAALESQAFDVVDSVEIAAPPATRGRRRRGASEVAPGAAVELAVDLAADEGAVVLVEEDGEYRWQLPTASAAPAPAGTRGRTRRRRDDQAADAAPRTATFTVTISPPVDDAALATRTRRGPVRRFFLGRVKAYVLKFVARKVGDLAMDRLERDVRAGLVQVTDARDPSRWALVPDGAPLPLQNTASPRVLLLVHGTFSSTAGSFGHLAHTAEGQRFLEGALARYDAVVGFDHHTLSRDPRQNAQALLDRLRSLGWPDGVTIDAVGFSRGGLVFRSLVEQLLPRSAWRPRVDRAVFVACTNGGTRLADPENWHELVNLHTNLAAASCRVLSLVPGAAPFALVFGEIISGVGALVKYLATHAVDEGGVPGLAAMKPDGEFVAGINAGAAGHTPAGTHYCVIASEFEPGRATDAASTGIAPRLLKRLADGFMDRLMGEANDLVVHCDSMSAIDREHGDFVKELFDFGPNGTVYHTTYFSQPKTVESLAAWLRVEDGAPTRRTRGVSRGRSRTARPQLPPLPGPAPEVPPELLLDSDDADTRPGRTRSRRSRDG